MGRETEAESKVLILVVYVLLVITAEEVGEDDVMAVVDPASTSEYEYLAG